MAIEQKIKDIAKELNNISIDLSSEATQEKMSIIAQQMKRSAENFIVKSTAYGEETLSVLAKKIEHNRKIRNSLKKTTSGKDFNAMLSANEEYQKTKEELSVMLKTKEVAKIFEIAEEFQADMNILLGQEVKLVYVYENNMGEPELYVLKDTDLLTADVQSRRADVAGRFASKKINEAIMNLKNQQVTEHVEKLLAQEEAKYDEDGAKNTYKESMSRYRYSRTKKLRFVMWNINGWYKMWISSEGDINEAYAAIILLNRDMPTFSRDDIEWNIGDFMENYVQEVDNMSGLLSGDITVGTTEYAIKSADASMLGIAQMKKLANEIINGEVKSLQDLRNYKTALEKKARQRNKETFIGNILDNTLTGYFEDKININLF